MKFLFALAAGALTGYWVVTKAMPAVQAKIEALDLDSVWDVWDSEEWM